MLKTSLKILSASFYTLLILIGVMFAVSNRALVELTFYPIPYKLSVPMYVLAIVLFAAGAFTAWAILRFASLKDRMQYRKTTKRMLALENEISALRSEQLMREQVALKPLSLVK